MIYILEAQKYFKSPSQRVPVGVYGENQAMSSGVSAMGFIIIKPKIGSKLTFIKSQKEWLYLSQNEAKYA